MTHFFKSLTYLTWLSAVVLLTPTICHAENNDSEYLSHLYDLTESKKTWDKIEWINLLHYQKDSSYESGLISQVDDSLFFMAKDGKINPESELRHTLHAFFDRTTTGNKHAQCRFVARLTWLKNLLDIQDNNLPVVDCRDYKEWRTMIKAEKVTMVFPAYHLNSPSSMFGHTLLRLDQADAKKSTKWLSFAINFGANVRDSDDSLAYAFKGLTGGYPGIFNVTPYFNKIKEYNRIENRDIWEYELNLSAIETERMIQHLWELKEMNFDYYFFDENCSYRLLELLEVARPGLELTDEFDLTAIPVDTVRAIERTNLITNIEYRPSQSTILQSHLNRLTEEEHTIVKELSADTKVTDSTYFTRLSIQKQKLITESAYQYLRYQKNEQKRDSASSKRSYDLLKILNTYPKDVSITPIIKTPSDPKISHESRRINITAGVKRKTNFAELSYKFSFHDLTDDEAGFLRGAQINIGQIKIRTDNDGKPLLHRLDLVDIFSLTPRTDFFKPLSWKVITGFERQITNNLNTLVYHVNGGLGVSYNIAESSQFYSLITARLEHNKNLKTNFEPAIGLLTGSLFHFISNTVKLEISGEQFRNNLYRVKASYEHNFVLKRNHSLKVEIKKEWQPSIDFTEAVLSYQYYY